MMIVGAAKIAVSETVGRTVLSGRQHGIADQPKLMAAANRSAVDGLVLVDLAGAEFLSSSYFDAALWPLWANGNEELYPILANVSGAAADDIELVLKPRDAAIWRVAAKKKIGFDAAQMLGTLESGLQQIIAVAKSKGAITAADLVSERPTESIGATAWSNRLALLHKFRLLRRRRDGRRLVYCLPWETSHG